MIEGNIVLAEEAGLPEQADAHRFQAKRESCVYMEIDVLINCDSNRVIEGHVAGVANPARILIFHFQKIQAENRGKGSREHAVVCARVR